MSRIRREAESSLDLLLDAICNTFGGVLFLAILVALLLSMKPNKDEAPEETEGVPEAAWRELQTRLQQAQGEFDALAAAAAEQDRLMQQFADPQIVQQLEELHRLRQQHDQLQSNRAGRLEEIAASEARRAKILEDLAELEASLDARDQELEQAQAELQAEVEQRTQTAELPYLRSTTKAGLALVVRYDRLYVVHRYNALGRRAGLNTNEFVVLDENLAALDATPKPYAGRPLSDPAACRAAVEGLKEQFPPGRYHLDVAIWDDSFDRFQDLKRAAIDGGYRYRLVPTETGNGIIDRGGDARVQ